MNNILYDEIVKVAYDFHEKRGSVHGYDLEDWLEAERIVMERHAKEMASEAIKTSKTKAKKAK